MLIKLVKDIFGYLEVFKIGFRPQRYYPIKLSIVSEAVWPFEYEARNFAMCVVHKMCNAFCLSIRKFETGKRKLSEK